MKITDLKKKVVQVTPWCRWRFVEVSTDEGTSGIGETVAEIEGGSALQAFDQIREGLIGRDPRLIESHIERFVVRSQANDLQVSVFSGVEQALWDILGKSLGTSVHSLLGGACRSEIGLYANINRISRKREERTPKWFAKNAAAAVADGFNTIKLAPFDDLPMGLETTGDALHGLECMRAVREAIGPDVDLMVDCHHRFTVDGALRAADALRDLNLFWFEQPVPESDLDDLRKVKQHCGMRIASGEDRFRRRDFWELLDPDLIDVIMPDVTVVGGIAELKKISAMAEARGITTAPHGPFGPVMIAAGAAVMATHADFLILEFGWGEADWRSDLAAQTERIDRSSLALPTEPGLGIRLKEELLGAHQISAGV
jgi:galactonate dehydratase